MDAETADKLRAETAALKRQDEDEQIEFCLLLAGSRNVKAARAVLEDRFDHLRVREKGLQL